MPRHAHCPRILSCGCSRLRTPVHAAHIAPISQSAAQLARAQTHTWAGSLASTPGFLGYTYDLPRKHHPLSRLPWGQDPRPKLPPSAQPSPAVLVASRWRYRRRLTASQRRVPRRNERRQSTPDTADAIRLHAARLRRHERRSSARAHLGPRLRSVLRTAIRASRRPPRRPRPPLLCYPLLWAKQNWSKL